VLDYGTAATKVGAMAKELNALLASLDQSLPQLTKVGQQASADAKDVVNHAFRLGVVLILVLGIVTILVVQVCRRLGRTALDTRQNPLDRRDK
jgi:small ligand-binding sensory domain FIST